MKKAILFSFLVFITKTLSASPTENGDPTTGTYQLKRVGDTFAAFKLNASGNVTEYFLVQGTTWDIATTTITDAVYLEGSEARLTGANGLIYAFSVAESSSSVVGNVHKTGVYGIAHYYLVDPQGITRQKAEEIALSIGGGGGGGDCEKNCLAGGCNSSSCQRELFGAGCSITCNDSSFACCGDLATYGCKCLAKTCCNADK